LGIKSRQLFLFLARLIDHEEIWKYTNGKWMGLDALGCMYNADFEKKN
jgi:hypothetical protein